MLQETAEVAQKGVELDAADHQPSRTRQRPGMMIGLAGQGRFGFVVDGAS